MNYQKITIKINDENYYESYLDDELIYKHEKLFGLIEGTIWKQTNKEGSVVDVFKDYLNNYKQIIELCKNIQS